MISLDTIIPFAVLIAVSGAVWALMSIFADRPANAEERLRRVLNPAARKAEAVAASKQQEAFQAKVAKAANTLGKSLRPNNEAEIGKIRIELMNAGFRSEQAIQVYYGLKVLSAIVGLILVGPIVLSKIGFARTGFTYVILVMAFGFYIPGLVLSNIRKKRMEQIFLGLPDAVDLMVVCVEAGLGLDVAMRRVTTELESSCPALCEEFAIANFQTQMGRPRRDVLRDLGTRTGVDDLRALAGVIIQAEKFGSSIGVALRVQSDSVRLKRRQLAEERAAKTAVKIMIPLILFIFPGVFVILVGPAALQIYNTLMNKV